MSGNSKVAIVTGASRGIGAEIARRLAKDGLTAVIDYSGDAAPAEALVAEIAGAGGAAIARVIDTPFGKRPFRVHIDPASDGAEVVNGVADRMREEMLKTIGLGDLLHPAGRGGQAHA